MTRPNRRRGRQAGKPVAVTPAVPADSPQDRAAGSPDRLLARYLRRAACSTAAGMGVFGLSADSTSAAITTVDAPEYIQKKLVGYPWNNNNPYIEWEFDEGDPQYPFRTTGWATEGFTYNYFGYAWPTAAWGMDLDGNGSGDVNFFRGKYFGGYLVANSVKVGYYTSSVPGSGQVDLLSNSVDNPDADGYPDTPPNTADKKTALQGFNAGEIIGDVNDVNIGVSGGLMRGAGRVGDWDGVEDNFEDLYGYGNPGLPSYVGFQISGLSTGTGTGFGWIEVIVREGGGIPEAQAELQIIRWAFTDDGSPIAAGDTGPVGLPGDYNDDGVIDAADYTVWRDNLGSTIPNDPTGDVASDADYDYWKAHFGETTPPGSGAITSPAAVPEPTTLGLLAAGGGALAFGYRRRKR